MYRGYMYENKAPQITIVTRRRLAPMWWILIVCGVITLILFVLKMAQVGLAAGWSWGAVFAPLWVPIVLFNIVRLLAFIEQNKPGGRR